MPNIPPLITHTPDAQSLFSASVADTPANQAGVSYNNGWTKVLDTPDPRVLSTIINVPGLQPGTPLSCTLQFKTRGTQPVLDGYNCWLIGAYATTNSIYIWINGGGGGTEGRPVDNENFGISWALV
jgi:hypothetical protein